MKFLKNTSAQCFVLAVLAILLVQVLSFFSIEPSQYSYFHQFILLVKQLFLNVLKMLIAPIVFFSLLSGVFSIGSVGNLKEMGKVTFTYYFTTTFIAILIGLSVVFFVHPWKDQTVDLSIAKDNLSGVSFISNSDASFMNVITGFVNQAFSNPFHALANNNILAIVVISLILGLSALYCLPKENVFSKFSNEVNIVIYNFLNFFIKFLPIGVFAIVFDLSLKMNTKLITSLISFSLVVLFASMIHSLLVLPSIAKFFYKISYLELFKKMARPMLVAMSTSSSSATLPVTMETCEKEFKVEKRVSSFVLPLGATVNMDGTALFEGIAAVFIAHLYNIELGTVQIFAVFFMAMVSSIGAPGMPSASMAAMQMVLVAIGAPLEAIGILLIVERPLDTFRTAINVQGDIIGSLVVQSHLNKNSPRV